jgi:hypothetical protein
LPAIALLSDPAHQLEHFARSFSLSHIYDEFGFRSKYRSLKTKFRGKPAPPSKL